ncbi:MurR/RpiR family transcriptional regulator [Vagococcus sp. BWB3-3]|uniref:MurR/RpiR family transcriptional regulator n=1 Tax=Vagococcus allomyrinae TaxID=2794353 RepID=A0A940SXR0_9ENTE|nr:MurR/RpiR family transcriptional regulator [Vagococcus allomyrinae]MBP1042628.1 MurR/RpiR family transcriptional regulator [Vagococcus allomyrinae]
MESKHVYHRVTSIFDDLTKSERKIARLVLDRPNDVLKMTATDLADESNTSPASVIRFCKSIGIPSFPELKLQLAGEREIPVTDSYSDVLPDEQLSDVKMKLLGNAYQSMKETIQLMDEATIMKAVAMIEQASIVYVYGVGSSNLVSENMSQKWNRVGKVCITMTDVHLLMSSLSSAPKGALFVGISNSGETSEVLAVMKLAQELSLKTMGITQFGVNSLSKLADLCIQTVRSKEAELRSAATSSLMSQFITLDVLFQSYVLQNYEENMAAIRSSRKAVDSYKATY